MSVIPSNLITSPSATGTSGCGCGSGGDPMGGLGDTIGKIADLIDEISNLLRGLADMIGGGEQPGHGSGPGSMPGNGCGCPGDGGEPGQVVAGEGAIKGDPHFYGADGGRYDVQGEAGKIYNLLSDEGFQMNGRFDAWGGGGATVVGEVGIVTEGSEITVRKDGTVCVDGRELADGECVRLADGGEVSKNGDQITVKSGEYEVTIDAKDSGRGDYLNINVKSDNVNADGVMPHGLLGQTFDGDGEARNGDRGRNAQGGGAIDHAAGIRSERGDTHAVTDYEVDSLHDTDFHFFNRNYDWTFGAHDIMADLREIFGQFHNLFNYGDTRTH